MMNFRNPSYSRSIDRQAEGEGILRMIFLAVALAMPLATLVYLKIQHTRISYEMSKVKAQVQEQEEVTRVLMLERSRLRKDDEIQSYAVQSGLQPRKQSLLVQRAFTLHDMKVAKLRPVTTDEVLPR